MSELFWMIPWVYTPEFGDDLVAAICDLLVFLWSSLGDLETLVGEDRVAGVGASSDLATVKAVAENLHQSLAMTTEFGALSPTLASGWPAAS